MGISLISASCLTLSKSELLDIHVVIHTQASSQLIGWQKTKKTNKMNDGIWTAIQ